MNSGRSPSEYLPERIESVRRRREWTQAELADAMNELGNGAKIDRSTIAKIESGKRAVAVDEVFWFAAALGVSPLALLLPRQNELVRVAPGFTMVSSAVIPWFRGRSPLIFGHPDQRFFEEERPDYEIDAERRLPGVIEFRDAAETVVQLVADDIAGEDLGDQVTGDVAAAEFLALIAEDARNLRRRLVRSRAKGV